MEKINGIELNENTSLKDFNNMQSPTSRKIVYSLEEIYDEVGGFGKA